jgi:DNA-binding transcriptional LysR family regulator
VQDDTLQPKVDFLRLRDLHLLDLIAQAGSLSGASERLHLTQPGVTHALQALEAAFGVKLVDRGKRGQRGVALTAAGRAALVRLRLARREVWAAIQASRTPEIASLRIGALATSLVELLPRALGRLQETVPSLEVVLVESTVPDLWTRLSTGDVDAIVCRLPEVEQWSALLPLILYDRVQEERLALVGAAKHPAVRKPARALAQLRQHPWALPPSGSFTRAAFEQLYLRANLEPPRPAVTCLSFHANLQLASRSRFLTVAPLSAVEAYQRVLRLKVIDVPWGDHQAEIVVAFRRVDAAHPLITEFRRCITAGA